MEEDLNEYPEVTKNIALVSLPTPSISSVNTVSADENQHPIEVSYTFNICMHAVSLVC